MLAPQSQAPEMVHHKSTLTRHGGRRGTEERLDSVYVWRMGGRFTRLFPAPAFWWRGSPSITSNRLAGAMIAPKDTDLFSPSRIPRKAKVFRRPTPISGVRRP